MQILEIDLVFFQNVPCVNQVNYKLSDLPVSLAVVVVAGRGRFRLAPRLVKDGLLMRSNAEAPAAAAAAAAAAADGAGRGPCVVRYVER